MRKHLLPALVGAALVVCTACGETQTHRAIDYYDDVIKIEGPTQKSEVALFVDMVASHDKGVGEPSIRFIESVMARELQKAYEKVVVVYSPEDAEGRNLVVVDAMNSEAVPPFIRTDPPITFDTWKVNMGGYVLRTDGTKKAINVKAQLDVSDEIEGAYYAFPALRYGLALITLPFVFVPVLGAIPWAVAHIFVVPLALAGTISYYISWQATLDKAVLKCIGEFVNETRKHVPEGMRANKAPEATPMPAPEPPPAVDAAPGEAPDEGADGADGAEGAEGDGEAAPTDGAKEDE